MRCHVGPHDDTKKTTSTTAPAAGNTKPIPTNGPQFAQPVATPDPSVFSGTPRIGHRTAKAVEPTLTLAQALGDAAGASVTADLQRAGQIVFHRENPGVISTQNDQFPALADKQLGFLTAEGDG